MHSTPATPRACARAYFHSTLLVVALSCLQAASLVAQDPDVSTAASSVLTRRCLDCHHAGEASGGLDLTTRTSAVEGGDSGPVIDDDSPLDSLLWQRIESDEMPPEHPLTVDEKATVKKWLKARAAWATTPLDRFATSSDRRAGRDWWSWQPLQAVPVPADSADNWSRNELDRFVWQKLQQAGLQPAAAADPRTLVRRLYFDLVGLPPPLSVVESLATNPSDENWIKLVDNLLNAPQYGEHWASHWLDVARFGESQGYEYNQPRSGAWQYRDWVIGALNRDLPYDEFARLQIAGDKLAGEHKSGLAPLGFLVAGPHNTVLGISDVMKETSRQEELEEIAGALGQAFLGLTVNCARCHDHKFDPITAKEYYAFIANLSGVSHGNRQAYSDPDPKKQQLLLARQTSLRKQLEQSYRQRNAATSTSANRVWTTMPPSANRPNEKYQLELRLSPTVWADASQATTAGNGVQLTLRRPDKTLLAQETFSPDDWTAAGRKQSFKTLSLEFPGDGVGQLVLELGPQANDGRFAGAVDSIRCRDSNGTVVWQEDFTPTQPDPAPGIQPGTSLPVHCRRQFTGWTVEGLNSAHAVEFAPGEFAVQIYSGSLDSPGQPETEEEQAWTAELNTIETSLTGENLFTVLSRPPGTMRVYNRGDVRQPRNEVAPSGLSLVAGPNADFNLDKNADDSTRRAKLAEWITAPDNGLFLRVAVNRVWHHHLGAGLLVKTSDFGFNGGKPSHPELLDWLALWFREHNHSLKQLHRLVVTSATWRQSSRAIDNPTADKAVAQDTSNRLLWRQNPRRLTAEMLRDGMLQHAGVLNLQFGGEGYRDFAIERIGDAHYYRHSGELDPLCWRRSIYRFRVRGDRSPLLESFDCPDPSATAPVRNITTTPTQALALWNNELVLEMSQRLAVNLAEQHPDRNPAELATAAWERVLQRKPNALEQEAATQLITEHGLEALTRVLFNSNEYLLVD